MRWQPAASKLYKLASLFGKHKAAKTTIEDRYIVAHEQVKAPSMALGRATIVILAAAAFILNAALLAPGSWPAITNFTSDFAAADLIQRLLLRSLRLSSLIGRQVSHRTKPARQWPPSNLESLQLAKRANIPERKRATSRTGGGGVAAACPNIQWQPAQASA